jgi:predicted DNA-binding transcriptional regulator YafY
VADLSSRSQYFSNDPYLRAQKAGKGETKVTPPSIETVFQEAGTEGYPVRISYTGEEGSVVRTVDPYEWKYVGTSRKLYGYCHEHGKTHSFVTTNIHSAQKLTHATRIGPYPYLGPRKVSEESPAIPE